MKRQNVHVKAFWTERITAEQIQIQSSFSPPRSKPLLFPEHLSFICFQETHQEQTWWQCGSFWTQLTEVSGLFPASLSETVGVKEKWKGRGSGRGRVEVILGENVKQRALKSPTATSVCCPATVNIIIPVFTGKSLHFNNVLSCDTDESQLRVSLHEKEKWLQHVREEPQGRGVLGKWRGLGRFLFFLSVNSLPSV